MEILLSKVKKFSCDSPLDAYKCGHCEFSADSVVNFIKHTTKPPKIFICRNCNFQTFSWFLRVKHKLDKCSKSCAHCSYKTNYRNNLIRHIKDQHTDPNRMKWYECDQCNHKTKRSDNLLKHIRENHTSVENFVWFKCKHCDYKAKRRNVFLKHIESKHRNKPCKTPKITLQCRFCEFKTIYRNNLKAHVHTKHGGKCLQCNHCDYKTVRLSHLKEHINARHTPHESIDWYECEHCSYKAKRRFHLKIHIGARHKSKKYHRT